MGSPSGAVAIPDRQRHPHRPLRVILDARKIEDGGIGVYIRNTIEGLLDLGEVEITLLGRAEAIRRQPCCDGVRVVEDPSQPYSPRALYSIGKVVSQGAFDLFHSPHFTLPFGITVPSIVTVHDLIHVTFPERFYYPWIASPIIKSSLRRASAIVTVSESSRRAIEEFSRGDRSVSQKIRVIPNAVRTSLVELADTDAAPLSACRPPYFLAVLSNPKPHKGLSNLLGAFRALKQDQPSFASLKLVLVGAGAGVAIADKDVIPLGHVTDRELAALYLHANALVVASHVEGFCLPIIEAHTFRTPVVARPTPAVVELLTPEDFPASSLSVPALTSALRRAALEPRRLSTALPSRYSTAFGGEALLEAYRATAGAVPA